MAFVIFQIEYESTVTLEARPGETLSETARRGGIALDAPCGGNGTCGKCRLRLLTGTVEVKPSACLSEKDFSDGWRLACCTIPTTDVTVFVPAAALAYRARIKTNEDDNLRFSALREQVSAAGLSLQNALPPHSAAVAVDLGTTTVCAVLLDMTDGRILATAIVGNGQIPYGADVIHRIIEQGKSGGTERLRNAVLRDTLMPLLTALCQQAQLDPMQVRRIGLVGNTTMLHLLLGINAQYLRTASEQLALLQADEAQLVLPVCPAASVRLAPCVGAFVGGDITAGVLATPLWNTDEMTLFIDLGTNGELVLGNRDFQLCCACSAGPAFEGGDISCGMRATDGAVEACSLDPKTLQPTLRVLPDDGQKPRGLCGSGLIDLVAELFKTGAIGANGRFVRENERIVSEKDGETRFVFATAEEAADGRELSLTETDIQCFLHAKAAVYAAVDILLAAVGMTESEIGQVLIAGGIGSGINLANAITVGMFPKLPLSRYRYLGNTALAGAYLLALSDAAQEKLEKLARGMTYLDLSAYPTYMDAFLAACFFPHTDANRFTL